MTRSVTDMMRIMDALLDNKDSLLKISEDLWSELSCLVGRLPRTELLRRYAAFITILRRQDPAVAAKQRWSDLDVACRLLAA